MRIVLFVVATVLSNISYSQLLIDSVFKDALAVKLNYNVVLDIEGNDKATYTVSKKILVRSAKAAELLNFSQYTNQFIKLDEANITLYDISGKRQESYSKKDMNKYGVGEGLVVDGAVYYKDITSSKFPCIIEFNYTLKYKGFIYFPKFYANEHNIACMQASYIVNCTNNDIQYKNINWQTQPTITDGVVKIYQWKFENLKPINHETGSKQRKNIGLQISPKYFSVDGISGEMSSWQTLGNWVAALRKGQNTISNDMQLEISNLIKNANSNKDKAKLIYEFLQKNFRYVSIQLGIGGYKPFSAAFTHQKKYGDCKALSNYMYSALQMAGVKSYHALINSGVREEGVDPNFPCNDFNHEIICIPDGKDTTWLECTSSDNAFGELGAFTENRNALLITENGGVLVNTPKSKWEDNVLYTKTLINPALEFNNVLFSAAASGEFKSDFSNYFNETAQEKRLQFLHYYINAKQPDEFNLEQKGNIYDMQLTYNKLHEFNAGSKHFYNIGIYNVCDEEMPTEDIRTLQYNFDYPYLKKDEIVFYLTDSFAVESYPENKKLENDYFLYEINFVKNEKSKSLICNQSFKVKNANVLAADFVKVKNLLKQINEEAAKKIVLKKLY